MTPHAVIPKVSIFDREQPRAGKEWGRVNPLMQTQRLCALPHCVNLLMRRLAWGLGHPLS